MTELEEIVKGQIRRFGPLNLAEYMNLCLLHHKHGYYITRDPLGAQGDFTTSPEISQMFGEMLGLSLAQSWLDQGAQSQFLLAELGPGRGTLMADILRATKSVPGFHAAMDIHLVEASPTLQEIQSTTLANYNISHAKNLSDLPAGPLFLIANEFFDALPIRQFSRTESNGTVWWQERVIGLSDNALTFGHGAKLPAGTHEDQSLSPATGDLIEVNAPAQAIIAELAMRLINGGGAAIIIDYGDWGSRHNTFQAVHAHQKVDPLTKLGLADLSAHVDFQALARSAKGVSHTGLTHQGVLLERLGITKRAEDLANGLTGHALKNHVAAHRRLTHPDEMGNLFQALAFHPPGTSAPPGFD